MNLSLIGLSGLLLALIAPFANASEEGRYLAQAGDCAACHTSQDGKPLAGGVPFATPVGTIYSTNITPDKTHGIGDYQFEDFDKAMRQGVAKQGHHLYPAMPYTAYAKLNDTDMRHLYDYFMNGVEPQAVENRAADIPWLLSPRWPLAVWNWMFHDDQPYVADEQQSAEWNRGAYLVQGAGHCGSCHTPRGWGMQEKALSDNKQVYLDGAELEGWFAPSLRANRFSQQDIVDLMKTGRSQHAAVTGPMADVVTHSSQFLTDVDLNGMAIYLLSLSGTGNTPETVSASAQQPEQNFADAPRLYASYCSTCHGQEGQGSDYTIPSLANNPGITDNNPATLLNVLINGAQTPNTQQHLGYQMPAYGWTLDETQLRNLANYLRTSWGNQAPLVTTQQVKQALETTSARH